MLGSPIMTCDCNVHGSAADPVSVGSFGKGQLCDGAMVLGFGATQHETGDTHVRRRHTT